MNGRRELRRVDGVLLLNKPAGITSNGALQQVRRLFKAERAGHTGTLDPMAAGLLPICLGEATKFSGELLGGDKAYEATLALGVRTSTGDAEGEMIERQDINVSLDQLRAALKRFLGESSQIPPMHSALKLRGRPLYEYARRGETVERSPRRVRIEAIDLIAFDGAQATISVTCSRGTYVRVLAEDIGSVLGCGAHLSALLRTRVGPFCLDQAITPERLGGLDDAARLALLLPPDVLLSGHPLVALDGTLAERFAHGASVPCAVLPQGRVRVVGPEGEFLGTGDCESPGTLRPRRLVRSDR